MTIQDMFAAAVTTKAAHPGYKVIAGGREIGPYSYQIAREVAAELHAEFLQDMQTGELIDP